MNDLITLAQQVGFPITVALYLLIRYDNRLAAVTKIIEQMSANMEIIKNHIQRGG